MLPYIKKGKTSKDFQNLPAGKTGIFNPSLAPGNVAIYDGDVNCDSASWEDTAGGNSITFFNAPTYNAAGLNGHGTILFNGVNQYGENNTISINQPFTIYFVFNNITYINGGDIIGDFSGTNVRFKQFPGTPRLYGQAGLQKEFLPQLALNNWSICTLIGNGVNGLVRRELNNPNYNLGTNTLSGLSFCKNNTSNMSMAFVIIRNVSDPIWLQNNFINWLKNRFAI